MTRAQTPPKYRLYRPKNLAVVRIDGRDHYLGPFNSPASREAYHRLSNIVVRMKMMVLVIDVIDVSVR